MGKNILSSISKADSLEKMGEFWDTHDFTDYDNPDAPDVKFDVTWLYSFQKRSVTVFLASYFPFSKVN
jgi:hypothetical protein